MPPDYAIILVYYVFGSFSILGSIYVLMAIHHMGTSTATTRLINYLHINILIQNVFSFPYVYHYNDSLCAAVAFIRAYCSFANAIVIAIFSLHYRKIFFPDSLNITSFFIANRRKFIFLTPLVTLFPFITDSYGKIEDGFCSVKTDKNGLSAMVIYYMLVSAIVGFSIIQVVYTIVKVYMQTDLSLASSVASSAGLYVVVSIFTWIPRVASRSHDFSYFDVGYFEYIAGIGYFFIFLKEEDSITVY